MPPLDPLSNWFSRAFPVSGGIPLFGVCLRGIARSVAIPLGKMRDNDDEPVDLGSFPLIFQKSDRLTGERWGYIGKHGLLELGASQF